MHGSEKEKQHGFKDGAIDFTAGSLGQYFATRMTSNDQILLLLLIAWMKIFMVLCICVHDSLSSVLDLQKKKA